MGRIMKKMVMMILSIYFALNVYAQENISAKVVEVTNYKEVVSKIQYPKYCKEQGIEGKVIVSLKIDQSGNLISHEFVSFPCVDMKEVVKNALSGFTFNPAVNQHGQTVASQITLPITFELSI
ncbi:MAG: TonB family protein [Bacteroidota bacterium]